MRRIGWVAVAMVAAGLSVTGASAQVGDGLTRVASAECRTGQVGRSGSHQGNPRARRAAQRALGFLGTEVSRWQEQHRCYGCHVQAVSLEALVVGEANGYRVPDAHMNTVLRGMLELPGGARAEGGLSYHVSQLLEPSNGFGGAAFAHYDEHIDGRLTDDLLQVAARLEEFQQPNGAIRGNYDNRPVAVGSIQTTTQAVQTWRQAYARSADEKWLRPIRRAEEYLTATAMQLADAERADTQHINYAILGLLAAGARGSERTLDQLSRELRERQREDGSWGGALETGQTVYALRRMGASDDDPAVRRGTAWLIEHQAGDGGWGHGGAARGTAMWAVLGLVSIDVASVEIAGVADGQHVSAPVTLSSTAADNEGSRIVRSEIYVGDLRVASTCGPRVSFRLDPEKLEAGRHIVRVVATNAAGRTGKKYVELYTGDHFLTEAGSRWVNGETVFSVRDVAPSGMPHRVVLDVYETRERNDRRVRGRRVRGRRVHREERSGAQGAVELRWNGSERGRYIAELRFVDDGGQTRQRVEVPFVHDSPEARHAAFGQVAGTLNLGTGGVAQNAQVELVDEEGNVVAETRSTRSGRYRFRDVERGSYRVRVRRQGFEAQEAPVRAAPAEEAEADVALH